MGHILTIFMENYDNINIFFFLNKFRQQRHLVGKQLLSCFSPYSKLNIQYYCYFILLFKVFSFRHLKFSYISFYYKYLEYKTKY